MQKGIFYFSIFYLIIMFISTIFGYALCTDKTKYANLQIPELALIDPGKKEILYKSESKITNQNIISKLFIGELDKPQLSINKNEALENQEIIERTFWIGTDKYGRDVFSRIIIGIRYTMLIGILSVLISLTIGVCLGSTAGYFGGKWDKFVTLLINIFWSLPTILLAFAILIAFGRNIVSIFIAIGITMWGDVARLVRGQVMSIKELSYIQAGKSMGFSNSRIIIQHILPNIANPIFISASANFSMAILLESGLSFLGLGLEPPIPTLGNILQEQYSYAFSGKAFLAIIPCIVVVLFILSFQIITNNLRDKTDIKLLER